MRVKRRIRREKKTRSNRNHNRIIFLRSILRAFPLPHDTRNIIIITIMLILALCFLMSVRIGFSVHAPCRSEPVRYRVSWHAQRVVNFSHPVLPHGRAGTLGGGGAVIIFEPQACDIELEILNQILYTRVAHVFTPTPFSSSSYGTRCTAGVCSTVDQTVSDHCAVYLRPVMTMPPRGRHVSTVIFDFFVKLTARPNDLGVTRILNQSVRLVLGTYVH